MSLSGHLGADHPLVKGMKEAMDNSNYKGAPYDAELLNAPLPETPETRTPRTSTSTVMRNQETQTEDDLTPVVNENTTLGPENRVSSWVVRTSSFQPREESPDEGQSPTDEDNVQTNLSEGLQQRRDVGQGGLVVNGTTPCVEGEEGSGETEPLVPMSSRIWRGFKKRFCLHP